MNLLFEFYLIYCRCHIPYCEISNQTVFEPHWLSNAIPYTNGKPEKCSRYKFIGNSLYFYPSDYCKKDLFNQSIVENCGNDGFVFKSDEISIQNEVRAKSFYF